MRKKPWIQNCHTLWTNVAILGLCATLTPPTAALAQSEPLIARYDVNDLSLAVAEAKTDQEGTASQRILLVFDIDNTLLTMPQFLGSDQWFNYHAGLISAGKDTDFSKFEELIAAQTALFSLASMKPTQDDVGNLIDQANSHGVDVFLLSARGPDLYSATKRELSRNRIAFTVPQACSFVICSLGGSYGDAEIRRAIGAFGGRPAPSPYREIVIRDGIMLVSGQDKGTMLRVLLAAIPAGTYKKIIFVDDTQKNIDSVAASGIPLTLSLYHYTRVPTAITTKEVEDGKRQWTKFTETACAIVSAPFCKSKP